MTKLLPIPVVDLAMGFPQCKFDVILICKFEIGEDKSIAGYAVPSSLVSLKKSKRDSDLLRERFIYVMKRRMTIRNRCLELLPSLLNSPVEVSERSW
jgi:hypothetical protein